MQRTVKNKSKLNKVKEGPLKFSFWGFHGRKVTVQVSGKTRQKLIFRIPRFIKPSYVKCKNKII